MKNKKLTRILAGIMAAILALGLVFSLTACSSDDDDDEKDEKTVKGECEICTEEAKLYEVDRDGETIEVCKSCKKAMQANANEYEDNEEGSHAVVRPLPKPDTDVTVQDDEDKKQETAAKEEEELEDFEEEIVSKPSYDLESMSKGEVTKLAYELMDTYEDISDARVEYILAEDWENYDAATAETDAILDVLLESYNYIDTDDVDAISERLDEQFDRITAALDAV